jgi:putative selenium metabolism hydrolase
MGTFAFLDDYKDEIVNFTQKLVRIPSFTGQEKEVVQAVLDELIDANIEETWMDEIGNVVSVLRGNGSGPNILLNGHMDVVPAGRLEEWTNQPFDAAIDKEGIIYGRGTADMKGGLAALVFTMKILKKCMDRGMIIPGNVIFSAVVYEEAAEMFGMEHLCRKTLPEKGLTFDMCFLAEPTNGQINLGHRGKVEMVIQTFGKTAHSSRPWQGINALEKMVLVLNHIFKEISPNLPVHPDLGKCSITVTNLICRPGTMSIVPDECEISVDRRYLPSDTLPGIQSEFEEFLDNIHKQDPEFKAKVKIRTYVEKSFTGLQKEVQKCHPVWLMEKDHPVVIQVQDALKKVGISAKTGYFIGGVDGAMTAGVLGIPTIGYSGADESLAHTNIEHTSINTLIQDLKAYLAIIGYLFDFEASDFFDNAMID